jgi:Bax protein
MHSKAVMQLVALMVVAGCGPTAADSSEPVVESRKPVVERPQERFEFTSYEQVQTLFDKLNYTPESWQAGIREVPRVYLTEVAPRWRDTVSKEVTVLTKKRIFFRALAPLALRSNELILNDRERMLGLSQKLASGGQIDGDDRQWLAALAVKYGVFKDESEPLDRRALDELIVRVDVVPVSLVLAQCAEESGWGTSRFAAEGNALFGQWSWGGEGIKPQQQREGMGDYRIAAFETPLASVMAYMMNLNTHAAYAALRARRAQMRENGERISGWTLAETLDKYSERGAAYVDSLHGIMKVNKLDPTDDAFLGDGPTILLIPVDKETK